MFVKTHRLYGVDGKAVQFEKTPNQGKKLTSKKPEYIVIHYTAGGSQSGAVNWFKNPDADASAHLVIAPDGNIIQMVRFDEKAWHAGTSSWQGKTGLNRYSVGIELVNWGQLKGGWGGWKSWTGAALPDERVIVAKHKHNHDKEYGWEVFNEQQVEACIMATKAIAKAYMIPDSNVVGHDDISPGRKVDPGPAWDMDRFIGRVFGRKSDSAVDRVYRVRASSGLNMRVGPGIEFERKDTLPFNTKVVVIEKKEPWWLVAVLVKGEEDTTGWVHSRWLAELE